jgi:hypothetical protein
MSWLPWGMIDLRGIAMRFLVLLALILCFAALLAFGFLVLVRELLARDIFGTPSLPSGPPEQIQAPERETESHSAAPQS